MSPPEISTNGGGVLRKIAAHRLGGSLGATWRGLDFLANLEAIIWLVSGCVLLVKGFLYVLSWLS